MIHSLKYHLNRDLFVTEDGVTPEAVLAVEEALKDMSAVLTIENNGKQIIVPVRQIIFVEVFIEDAEARPITIIDPSDKISE